MTDPWAEAIHEPEVRPGRSSGFHDHRRPGPDFNNHHDKTESARPVHGPVCDRPLAIVHIAELTAVDEPQRARPQAPSTPIRPQLAPARGIAGEQQRTGSGGRRQPGCCPCCRTARRGNSVTAATAAQDQGCDQGDQGNSCYPGKPGPGRQTGITPWALADLIQPSHPLQTGRCTSVSLSCLAGRLVLPDSAGTLGKAASAASSCPLCARSTGPPGHLAVTGGRRIPKRS